jgi:hypothetical protein
VRLDAPAWLAGQSDDVIDELVESLSDRHQQRFRQLLGEEVRGSRPGGVRPGLLALERLLGELTPRASRGDAS